MADTLRSIVEETFGFQRCKKLWTANYYPALSLAPQDFDVGALLPAMLYMARWGHRRGKGNFASTFGREIDGKLQPPTIADVARGLLSQHEQTIVGFEGEIGEAVLGDLLLAWCLENRKHAEGHDERVQRIFATHYLASWIDLPDTISNLRGVPELLTSLLADQAAGEWLEPGQQRGRFPVGVTHAGNALLDLLGRHMTLQGAKESNLASDTFDDRRATDIGVDELLVVRLAQSCRSAPLKARGRDETERIPNRFPLARLAGEALREDLATFIQVYGEAVPRQAFMQMMEAGIALGLTNLLLASASLLDVWERAGEISELEKHSPWPLFVDASQGQDKELRDLSEASLDECFRRFERFPVLMMLLRVLDDRTRTDRKLREQIPASFPDATALINLLGEIYRERHGRAEAVLNALDEDCQRLAEGLEAKGEASDTVLYLRDNRLNPAWRLAETLCGLMGDKQQRGRFMNALDSALMTDRPNGLAIKRRVRRTESGISRAVDLRALVLTPPVLDYLVHRHLRKSAKGKPLQALSMPGFFKLLRERYGLYVDRQPRGHSIPQELLLRNKTWLERRLRDLGLLIGVNDAESMKQLKPRYRVKGEHVA